MGEVVTFPEEELGYWLCDCGCQTHYVRTDGEAECAHCGNLASGAGSGGWLNTPPPECVTDKPVEISHVVVLDSADVAIRRVLKRHQSDNMRALVVLWADGIVSTWGDNVHETRAVRGWVRRGLETARKALVA